MILRQGSVFFLQHRDLTSPLPHFFIVLNACPLSNTCLVLAVASSQIEKVRTRRKGLPQETLVEVSPNEYDDFTVETIIDCNSYLQISLHEFQEKLKIKEVQSKKDIPDDILQKIIMGINNSPLVEENIKELL